MRSLHILSSVLAGLVLASCGTADPVPPDIFYRLQVGLPVQGDVQPALPGILQVGALDGDGLVRGRPLLYTSAEHGEVVRQHNYHHWADSPSRLVQGQLVAFLKDSDIAQSVVTPDMRVRADYELIGKIQRLDRVFGTTGSSVVVALELAIVRQSDRKLVLVDSYRAEVSSDDDSVDASVQAMNTALEQVFMTFTSDLIRRTAERRRAAEPRR